MKNRITKTDSQEAKSSPVITKIKKTKLQTSKTGEKTFFHHRSKHRGQYEFPQLISAHAGLGSYVRPNKFGVDSVDFSDPMAVKELNTALLKHFYKINYWDIPEGYLCPPIPGRADYIHHISDLFTDTSPSTSRKLKCLDIGVGANCIYPIIGIKEYDWTFIVSDIDELALDNVKTLIKQNSELEDHIEVRLQKDSSLMLKGILKKDEMVDVVVCNPPFHESATAASKATNRKFKNLGLGKDGRKPELNFGGKATELWCDGGEKQFIKNLISESKEFANQCFWFTTLVSKKETLNSLVKTLEGQEPFKMKIIRMNQGNKSSRILAWTFLDADAQKTWMIDK